MNTSFRSTGLLLLVLVQSWSYAQNAEVENSTLQKVKESMASKLPPDSALSATFVRTSCAPQSLHSFTEKNSPEVVRTTISELKVNQNGLIESVFEARKTGWSVKEHKFQYSNNGKCAKVYDVLNNQGVVAKSQNTVQNYLSLVLNPYTATRQGRFISREIPTFQSKLKNAKVTSETNGVIPAGNCIILEGEYENSDPEHFFKITVLPEFGYAVAKLEEYDKNKRILVEISTSNFIRLCDLWLSEQTNIKKYNYDDYSGNTVYVAVLDILEPKTVPVDESTFLVKTPHDAKLYDATSGIDLGEITEENNDAIMDVINNSGISAIPLDKKDLAIVSRTKKAYEDEIGLNSVKQANNIAKVPESLAYSRALKMPESKFKQLVFKTLWGLLAITVTMVVYIILKKKKLKIAC